VYEDLNPKLGKILDFRGFFGFFWTFLRFLDFFGLFFDFFFFSSKFFGFFGFFSGFFGFFFGFFLGCTKTFLSGQPLEQLNIGKATDISLGGNSTEFIASPFR